MVEVKSPPYPVTYEDDSMKRFGDREDTVFIEVSRARISRPLDNLAIHYRAFFPAGETVRPGDLEEYLDVAGKTAYRVLFRTEYIRRRKRLAKSDKPDKPPEGWTVRTMEDPLTGKNIPVFYGPVIPRQKILYLVQGDLYLYYVFFRADGDSIEPAKKKFDELVQKGIAYR